MRRALTILYFLLGSVPALPQNWTTVSASNITDLNQNKLAAGQLCFLATDQYDNPISFSVGGGGQVLRRAVCAAVLAGAVSAFTVPNPANTQPAGVYYRVTVKDTSTGQEVLRYTAVTFAGATLNFDSYQPNLPGASLNPPSGNSVAGNLSVSGNLSVTGTVSGNLGVTGSVNAPAFNPATRGDRKMSIQNPDFEGSTVIPPPGWTSSGTPTMSYETSSPAPNKLQSLKIATTTQNSGASSVTSFSVVPGDTYSLACAVKSDGTGTAGCYLSAYDKNHTFISSFAGASTNSTSWTTLASSGTVPAGAVQVLVNLLNVSTTQPSTVWVDEVSVQKTNFPGNLVVGGPNPATGNGNGGLILVPNNTNVVVGRNNANNGDIIMLSLGAAGNPVALGGLNSGALQNLQLNGPVISYNGVNLVANGFPAIVAKADATAQQANIGNTQLYAVPANGAGTYRVSGYVVITQAATTSSTLPGAQVVYTDNDTNVGSITPNITQLNSAGTAGSSSATAAAAQAGAVTFQAKAGTSIQYATSGYASSGATPMQYALHIKLEYLGN
jgi:hypothetical protein